MAGRFRVQVSGSSAITADRSSASFTVSLASSISLSTPHEVALERLFYPSSVENIRSSRFSFYSHEKNFLYVHVLPDGTYAAEDLTNYINAHIISTGDDQYYKLVHNLATRRFRVEMSQPASAKKTSYMEFSPALASIMGFETEVSVRNGFVYGSIYNMLGDASLMHVCLNGTELTNVGTTRLNLLDTVPVQGFDGDQRQRVFEPLRPAFNLFRAPYVQSITLQFLNARLAPYPFSTHGDITAILSFKALDYDIDSLVPA